MLIPSDMTARFLKTFAATLLAFTLSYYSVAWAVLQCLHEEDDLHPIAVSDAGHALHHGVALIHAAPNLECSGPECVIESMSDSSSQSRSINVTGETGLKFATSFTTRPTASEEKSIQWRRALFDGSSNVVPIYLSLSNLRI